MDLNAPDNFGINFDLSLLSSIRVETCGEAERTQLIMRSFVVFYFNVEKQLLLILKGTGNAILRD